MFDCLTCVRFLVISYGYFVVICFRFAIKNCEASVWSCDHFMVMFCSTTWNLHSRWYRPVLCFEGYVVRMYSVNWAFVSRMFTVF